MSCVRTPDGVILVPRLDAGRFCLRCGAAVHAPDPPHLCADIARRLRHAEASQRDATWSEYARELVVLGGEG